MKKFLKYSVVTIVVLAAAIYLFREPITAGLYDWVTRDMYVEADTDGFDPGTGVGEKFPPIHASYGERIVTDLGEFAGPNGLVVIANRSLDWCPFCMKQTIQLGEHAAQFERAGIGMVCITYDAPELQQAFIDKHGIPFPVLSDIDTRSFTALGILNEQYEPGEMAYGIPHPGMFVLDSSGRIAGKIFVEAYSTRVDAESSLAFARQALNLP